MATGSRPFVLDMSRTTTIIGELIQLTTDQEEITTKLGKEGFAYYEAGLFYDEMTLDMCRRVEGAIREASKSKRELEAGMEENLLLGSDNPQGPFTKLRRLFLTSMMRRELSAHERALREHYDELAGRIQGIANNDPRSLSAKMLKMVAALRRIKADIDLRWAELETRVKNERKGPMFVLILNMFVVNFFKFSNYTWFRHWIAKMEAFQQKVGERIHKEVEHDLSVEDEEAPAGRGTKAGVSGAERMAPEHDLDADDAYGHEVDLDQEEASPPSAPPRAGKPYAAPRPSAPYMAPRPSAEADDDDAYQPWAGRAPVFGSDLPQDARDDPSHLEHGEASHAERERSDPGAARAAGRDDPAHSRLFEDEGAPPRATRPAGRDEAPPRARLFEDEGAPPRATRPAGRDEAPPRARLDDEGAPPRASRPAGRDPVPTPPPRSLFDRASDDEAPAPPTRPPAARPFPGLPPTGSDAMAPPAPDAMPSPARPPARPAAGERPPARPAAAAPAAPAPTEGPPARPAVNRPTSLPLERSRRTTSDSGETGRPPAAPIESPAAAPPPAASTDRPSPARPPAASTDRPSPARPPAAIDLPPRPPAAPAERPRGGRPAAGPSDRPAAQRPTPAPNEPMRAQIIPRAQRRPDVFQLPKRVDAVPLEDDGEPQG